jgi:hypothetical protein
LNTSSLAANQTVQLDVSSISILERSNITKPPKFTGIDFNLWSERLKFYLLQYSLESYLTDEPTTAPEIEKSKKCTTKILELLSEEIQSAFFTSDLNAASLWSLILSSFSQTENKYQTISN